MRKLAAAGAADLEASLIVPARALAELSRVLKGEPGKVEVIISKARNQVFFRAGTSEFTSRLIDGKYPNYAQVIPSKSSTKVRVSTAELTQTVRAVSLFARDSANVIRLKAQAGALILSATTNEVGDSKAEVAADVDGPDIQIAFNARYVLDALGVIGEDHGRAPVRRSAQPRPAATAGQGALPLRDHARAGGDDLSARSQCASGASGSETTATTATWTSRQGTGINVFIGANGQGKTNLLEAVAMLALSAVAAGSP